LLIDLRFVALAPHRIQQDFRRFIQPLHLQIRQVPEVLILATVGMNQAHNIPVCLPNFGGCGASLQP
jgi:hypothetical protein